MLKASLAAIIKLGDKILRVREIGDCDRATNGLQIGDSNMVTRIVAAVDGAEIRADPAVLGKQPGGLGRAFAAERSSQARLQRTNLPALRYLHADFSV